MVPATRKKPYQVCNDTFIFTLFCRTPLHADVFRSALSVQTAEEKREFSFLFSHVLLPTAPSSHHSSVLLSITGRTAGQLMCVGGRSGYSSRLVRRESYETVMADCPLTSEKPPTVLESFE